MSETRRQIHQYMMAGSNYGESTESWNNALTGYESSVPAPHSRLLFRQKEEVAFSHVEDPSCFFIHLLSEQDKLTDMMVDMHRFYERREGGATWTLRPVVPIGELIAVK